MFKVLSDFSPGGVRQSSLRKDREWDSLAGFFLLTVAIEEIFGICGRS